MDRYSECIPDVIKDVLGTLNEENVNFQKYLQCVKEYLDEDPVKHTRRLLSYILNNINVNEIQKNICHYLADIIVYIQHVNKMEYISNEEVTDGKNERRWECNNSSYPEYRIEIRDEKLKKYIAIDYRKEIIRNCTKNINYLKLMYIISNNVLPPNGYVLFINILHKREINYQYKLLTLEYFANVANKITIERAKYIAQILPLVLEIFYNIEGEPYYNDNINNLDTLISMCKFVNVLCDESIKTQEDDRQDVALYSIVAFIMRIISYHNADLPLNKNVEKLFKYITYDDINYEECLKICSKPATVSPFKYKKEDIVRDCLSSLTWRLSVINPNLHGILERVNILIPNTKACALENSTLEISVLCYLILIERINVYSFPLVFSELYLFNLMIRNSYNLILCVPKAKERIRNNLLIKAYHFICICSVLSKIIKKRNDHYYSNIYKFKWRPFDFLKKIYETLHTYSNLKMYTKVIYNCISNIMRNFYWDVFYSLYSRLIIECTVDQVRSTISAFVKDELYKQMIRIIKKCESIQQSPYKRECNPILLAYSDGTHTNSSITPFDDLPEIQQKENQEEDMKKSEIIEEINKLGYQIRKIIYILIGEESVLLYIDSITVALNMIKMILLNKKFRPFCKYILNFNEMATCFLQNKIKYFHDQIKIEKSVLTSEMENRNSLTPMMNQTLQGHVNVNSTSNDVNLNKLEIIVMLLTDVENIIAEIKLHMQY
ncbi:conserved Plasmodium protein, unknown function [Plasmodium ovale]|uniref:Uncharacterized protein n=2 Tax=Plasmodium ovale TaxID=36330 RepID=A0A1A8W8N8_PLAOA|nr:conserved Plasmodium protein, unknown function [Plasmodium ovale curtisi]SBS98020.1 conserved Plasmodium protein, unknown function [Plasmodium ovale curtisi]SCQ16783.1 conserved Plasmodium protein, unknown function [Plasmodium ovale]